MSVLRLAILCLVVACGATVRPPAATTGAIAGLARDQDSGDPVAKAQVKVRPTGGTATLDAVSNDDGLYDVDNLKPGTYELTAMFAGQPVTVVNIAVARGETTYVDVVFTLGRPEPLRVDYNDAKKGQINRYRPPNLSETVSLIEGTVNDLSTRERIPGAVVTAVTTGGETQQTVSDDHGRFRFDPLPPGTYSVSAYYSIGGRGQVEVRRSQIQVVGAEAVVVPLWIETVR